MKFIYTLFLFSICVVSQAQQKTFQIEWEDRVDVAIPPAENKYVPGFQQENFVYNEGEQSILFSAQWEESGIITSSEITNVNYESVSESSLQHINKENIPAGPQLEISSARARDKQYLLLSVSPIVKENGVYRKITSFTVRYNKGGARQNVSQSVPPVSSSVLASGNWFRFYVEETGIYRISRSFLNELGIDVSSVDPRRIKIYGHGGEMLPLQNNENDEYDLPETAIKVIGESDGSFDNNDYILFYAQGTRGNWSQENDTNLNLYDDRSFYYITVDGDYGKRVSTYIEPSGNVSTNITEFDDYQYYEEDLYSIVRTGRRWYGDRFDVESERTYEFDFPSRVQSAPIEIDVSAAAASEVSTSMNVEVNGTSAGNLSFGTITDDIYARGGELSNLITVNSENINVNLNYSNGGNPASLAYLNYINIKAKRELRASNLQLAFTYDDAATTSGIGQYNIQNANNVREVWDVTNPAAIRSIANENGASNFNFKAVLGEARKYVALTDSDFYTPMREANPSVNNQDLKGSIFENAQGNFEDVDYLMITSSELRNEANRLAAHRKNIDGLNIKVVLLENIYQEFSSGKQDIGAIRNFIKYVYDNASNTSRRLKYVCLFGDTSVDYKNRLQNNNNIVPAYHELYSFSIGASSTASDDFFGMMDATEGGMDSSDKLDIAVGRILADTPQLAKTLVDKIIAYESKASYGSWRNNFLLISDDADEPGSAHADLQFELDAIGDEISANKPFINVKKIHSDAYEQVSSAGGFRYPEVNEDISEAIEVGACVVNYFGHGGENGLAAERIVTVNDIQSWKNENRYNIFVTVTCEFTRFDNPARVSPGEQALFNTEGGSVALVTTTRSITVSTGTDFNSTFAPFLFDYNNQGDSAAESLRKAKNIINRPDRRVIFYFGDPAMKLALPKPEVRLKAINDVPISQAMDTLKALGRVKISGEVVNSNGSLATGYNGVLSTTIFDKRIDRQTLGNDNQQDGDGLIILDYTTLGEIIFRGQASVNNGAFEFDFVVPKDIAIPVGEGRLSFYSERDGILEDNHGYNNSVLVGGINEDAPEDNIGPEIELYMNDENFVSGGVTNSAPFLLAKLSDENGINTASGIGHDLVAIIDGDETNPFVVNDYYETEVDDFTKGTVNYKLRDLEEGLHTLTFKAWDVYNNSSTAEIQFVVAGDEELKITNVLNYPNPFSNYTEFWFNHNRPFEPLEVQVQVFTVTGKVVWTRNQLINTDGFLSRDITWDGKDDFGDAIGKGVYVYKLTVKSTLTNKKVEKFEKLVIL